MQIHNSFHKLSLFISNHHCHDKVQQFDLRYGAKRSLADPPRLTLALKSCDISSTRPHLLIVGGNDAFARLYYRRMFPPLTSCQKRMLPPTSVNYFCPMHLSDRVSFEILCYFLLLLTSFLEISLVNFMISSHQDQVLFCIVWTYE
ncbi:hypothetical protein ERO13_D08G147200v2 [Gossypium hirsutum]|uniref:Protein ALTERED SEED GERMINATION 2 isoform X1 n=3 Tax=Gossypium TaxID=3633 RepID=A0A1U8J1W3_GOSHI|nr:protein ALTERED SEED GERMINATION 2 isoform X1 [Gossypium hirsutum]KAB2017364.1 hypothetical protein ES319_D08G158600v1 [Gossypium barbadense]KAG4134285.1 hypothetical protein ERO13_D08G147200v2 [Gossypium hirsutum]TYH58576.1 hypothetical protein ES332_D08G164500v1 [Gossypium tomentosum]